MLAGPRCRWLARTICPACGYPRPAYVRPVAKYLPPLSIPAMNSVADVSEFIQLLSPGAGPNHAQSQCGPELQHVTR